MPCSLHVTIKLWMMPMCLAPSSVQQNSQDFLGQPGPALDLRAATVHENLQCAVERVATHRVTGERLQAVVGLTHVRRLPVQVHADLRLGEEHQPRAMLKITPAPSSRRTHAQSVLGLRRLRVNITNYLHS